MQRAVALRERGRLAVLLDTILQQARYHGAWREPDRRNLCSWRQLGLAILGQRSTCLLALAQALLPVRQPTSVKTLASSLSYCLTPSTCPKADRSRALLEAAVQQLEASQV